jgi:Zn-dependent protease with chaperone function
VTVVLYLPGVMAVLLAVAAPWLARRLAPAPGAVALAVAAAVVALSSFWSLSLLVVSLIDTLPDTPLLETVPPVVAVLAGGVLLWCAWRAAMVVWRQRRLRRELTAAIPPGSGELVVLADERPFAFALAGKPGRIVVTASMLRALTIAQRRAMFAHERSHLARRHAQTLTLARLAAAANPILAPVRAAVGYLCERQADEAAADEVGDRFLVAEALAAAALAAGTGDRRLLLGFHRLGVAARVAALVAPPRYRSAGLVTAATMAVVALSAAWDATDQFYRLIGPYLA